MKNLLVITGLLILTSCVASSWVKVAAQRPSSASVIPLSQINLAAIGRLAPKGRVQDGEYNDLPVVKNLLAHGKESIPYLISKLDDETKIESQVVDYWYQVYVGDVALMILSNFFTDASWRSSTIPGVLWDEFLERGENRDITGEQVLRNYISKHGRKKIKNRWQQIWREYQNRVFWDDKERCFKVKTADRPINPH